MDFKGFMKVLIIFIIIIGIGASAKYLSGDKDGSNSGIISEIAGLFGAKNSNARINGVIMGTDEGGTRTDFLMFVSFNPNNKKVNMISLPRDTRVPNSNDRKINSLYAKGKEDLVIKDVEFLLEVPIDYYAVVNLKALREFVDEIGGIPVNVPMDMKYSDPAQNFYININKGYQILDGAKAEGFVRYRSGYPTADLGRIEAQHEFINAAIAQIKKPENIVKIPSLINIITENIKTNMSSKEMLKYLGDLAKVDKESIIIERLPGEPKYINGLSYYVYDKEKTRQMIQKMFTNEEDIEDSAVIERNKAYKIEVYNGTSISGFGSKIAENLRQKGFNVVRVDNWDVTVKETKIYERNRKAEGSYVKNVLHVGIISADYSADSDVDLTVVIGSDANQ